MYDFGVKGSLDSLKKCCNFQDDSVRIDWKWIEKNPSDFFQLTNSLYCLCKLGALEKCGFDEEVEISLNVDSKFLVTVGFVYHFTPKGLGLFIRNL